MRFFAAIFTLLFLSSVAHAQSPEEEVRNTIDRLFDGMRAGDSTMVASVFHEEAIMVRATDQGLRSGSVRGFIQAVGTPHDEVWDEKIWDVQIMIDGRLATAWMEFAFFLGENLSHCGVNSIMLYNDGEQWSITYLADTRREACDLPESLGN